MNSFLPIEAALDDAVDTAIRDQESAGIDVISDGEMRRAGFFTAEFYRHLTGLRALEPGRRLGAGAHDQQHRFAVLEPIAAPAGLGVVDEFRFARTRTTRPLRVTLPGPFTLSGRLASGPGEVYPTRVAAAEAHHMHVVQVQVDHALVEVGAANRGIRQDGDNVGLHFQNAARNIDQLFFELIRHFDAHRPRFERGQQRGVTRIDAELAALTGSDHHFGAAGVERLFSANDVDV